MTPESQAELEYREWQETYERVRMTAAGDRPMIPNPQTVWHAAWRAALAAHPASEPTWVQIHDSWMANRIEWLASEAHKGGNWEYLKIKWMECAYILEKFRAAAPVPGAKEGT